MKKTEKLRYDYFSPDGCIQYETDEDWLDDLYQREEDVAMEGQEDEIQ